jgi:hypothetical protein
VREQPEGWLYPGVGQDVRGNAKRFSILVRLLVLCCLPSEALQNSVFAISQLLARVED